MPRGRAGWRSSWARRRCCRSRTVPWRRLSDGWRRTRVRSERRRRSSRGCSRRAAGPAERSLRGPGRVGRAEPRRTDPSDPRRAGGRADGSVPVRRRPGGAGERSRHPPCRGRLRRNACDQASRVRRVRVRPDLRAGGMGPHDGNCRCFRQPCPDPRRRARALRPFPGRILAQPRSRARLSDWRHRDPTEGLSARCGHPSNPSLQLFD